MNIYFYFLSFFTFTMYDSGTLLSIKCAVDNKFMICNIRNIMLYFGKKDKKDCNEKTPISGLKVH